MNGNVTINTFSQLRILQEHELYIARLYEAYADRFPQMADFWRELSAEEIGHANWLGKLLSDVESGSESILIERFPIAAVQTSMKYIQKQIGRVDDPEFSLLNALSIAMHLEEALIENKYFEVLDEDGEKTRQVLALLARSTQTHLEKVRKAVQQFKS
ncbi:MAG: hypothetical protein JXA82_09765 [Sedimentisphaerales bacterium]|nr:hypothetical protein [Sedimentisphaerales bacterium]